MFQDVDENGNANSKAGSDEEVEEDMESSSEEDEDLKPGESNPIVMIVVSIYFYI